jgi:hypothetical protein
MPVSVNLNPAQVLEDRKDIRDQPGLASSASRNGTQASFRRLEIARAN